jgi:hypothetical protein
LLKGFPFSGAGIRSLHKALIVKSFLKEGFVLNYPPNSRDHWKLMMEMAAGFSLLFGTASGFSHPSVNEKAMVSCASSDTAYCINNHQCGNSPVFFLVGRVMMTFLVNQRKSKHFG